MSRTPTDRKPQDAAAVVSAILSILDALAGTPPGSPAGNAYISALRRRGEDLAALGGVDALHAARAAAVAASPDHAGTINAAWNSIPGWAA